METLDLIAARRLALARAALLTPGPGGHSRTAAHEVIERFGYLQLDTVSIAGARSHGIVLHSRIDGFDTSAAEELLHPGAPLFEYWGHEVSWLPMEMYPVFAFRRRQFKVHPWWGDVLGEHPAVVKEIKRRLKSEGPLRTVDSEGARAAKGGWWNLKVASRVAAAMWSAGELAVRERKSFHRSWDLVERVIPQKWRRARPLTLAQALCTLLLKALHGHGWATTGTLERTWRLVHLRKEVETALARLQREDRVVPCAVDTGGGRLVKGWARPEDLQLADRLRAEPLATSSGVLLSPFDPLLWDRARVKLLFGFEHALEIYKPADQRTYGYFVLPVLAGERLVGRVDLKTEPGDGLRVLACHLESKSAADKQAVRHALKRYGRAVKRKVVGGP